LLRQEMTDSNSPGHKNREPIKIVKVTPVLTVDDAGWAPIKMGYTSKSIKFATLTTITNFDFYYMFYKEKLLYDSKLTVPAKIAGENYTGTPDLIPVIFSNGSKIQQWH